MKRTQEAYGRRYAVALLAFTCAVAITIALRVADVETPPFLLFFAAVSIAAGYGGLWPGLACTLLAALTALPLSISPQFHELLFHRALPVHTAIFAVEG